MLFLVSWMMIGAFRILPLTMVWTTECAYHDAGLALRPSRELVVTSTHIEPELHVLRTCRTTSLSFPYRHGQGSSEQC